MRGTNTALNIEILGVNQPNAASGNRAVTAERNLPWLQDSAAVNAGGLWKATYRDVQILDWQNNVHAVYNLTSNDLGNPANYAALKALFLQAAQLADSDKDQLPDPWELYFFGDRSALPTDDPDQDGVDNATEFAFGTGPLDAKSFRPITFEPAQSGARPATVSFRRRAETTLDYVVETSTDLKQWLPAGPTLLAIQPPRNLFNGTGTSEVLATPTSEGMGAPARFIRVTPRSLP